MIKSKVLNLYNNFKYYLGYRKRFASIPGFMEVYKKENLIFGLSRVRSLSILGILLYSGANILDYLLFPEVYPQLVSLRIGFLIITFIFLGISFTKWGKQNTLRLLFINAILGDFGISYMAALTGGWTGLYFVGNILMTTGVTMFIPWRPQVNGAYCSLVLIGYVALNSIHHSWALPMLIPVVFIFIVGIQAIFSTIGSEMNRMAQLAARLEIEKSAALVRKQIEAAKEIQQTLLPPKSQHINGIFIEAIYEPSEGLSGDFFDTIASGDWVYVYLSDVTGHGVAAAQITYLVKGIFNHAVTDEINLVDLFDIVREKYVAHQLEYDLGLQLMRVNTKNLNVEYLRSNAPEPVLVDEESKADSLTMLISPLISMINYDPKAKAEVGHIALNESSTVYVYSDGAYEFMMNSGAEFGQRRLTKALASTHLDEWPNGLIGQLKSANKDTYFGDDLTILRISPTQASKAELIA